MSSLLNNSGIFIPTTNVYEIDQLQEQGLSKELVRNILVHIYQDINNVALSLNAKDSAQYQLTEFLNGQVLFANYDMVNINYSGRQIFRIVINVGPLPDTATVTIPHNIVTSNATSFTRIYGCSTNPITMQYLPIPYSSCTSVANNIELSVDSNNVYITTGINQSAYTTTYVILEYVKE